MGDAGFASRVRETFIELAPGEMKAWRLPPCTPGFFNIWATYAEPGGLGGGGGAGGSLPDPGAGGIARYRDPFGPRLGDYDILDPGTGGGTGPALELDLKLINHVTEIATPKPNDVGHIFFDATDLGDDGKVWILQIARKADGSIGKRRYRIRVTYPSVLPVETVEIPASFFERGFERNWNDNPYLDYVRITSDRIAFRWNKRYAQMYNKPTDDQYIPLPYSDWYNLPTIVMTSIEVSVGAGEGPYPPPDGIPQGLTPYLKLKLECQCEGSRKIEFTNPGPDIFDSITLPEKIWFEVKFFLGLSGSYNSPGLCYYPVVKSPLLDMINYNVTYITPSGTETINLKQAAKKAAEDGIAKLQTNQSTGGNIVNDYVRPYIVGQYDLYGIGWDASERNILAHYVGKQKRPAPSTSPLGNNAGPFGGNNAGGTTSDGSEQVELDRLFDTPEEMPLDAAGFPNLVPVDAGNLSKIDHIVVLMQENRSFDQVLGYLSRDGMLPRQHLLAGDEVDGREALQTHVDGLLPGDNPRDLNSYQNVDYRSTRRRTTAWPSYSVPGPSHNADAVTRQVADGMKDFVMEWARHASGSYSFDPQEPADPEHKHPLQLVMDYLTDAELPAYGALTREFAVCDHWHCSHLGGTLPNRFISLAGDFSRDIYGSPEVLNPELKGFSPLETPTFFDHLTERGVEWRLFEHGYSMLRLVKKYTFDQKKILSFEKEFEAAVETGLPPVTFIEPDYIETPTGVSNDDHAPADMMNGQRLIARIMSALLSNEEQWAKTLFIITYDEHGGFYDHALPPTHIQTENPDGSVTSTPIPTLSVGEPRLGVRVPAFVISPFIPGAGADGKVNVTHKVFDHTSIPATILRRFCGPKAPFMGNRWAAAADVGELLILDVARPDSDFDRLRQEMAVIASRPAARLTGDTSEMLKPPLRKPGTEEEIEDNFSGLLAFASSMAGLGR